MKHIIAPVAIEVGRHNKELNYTVFASSYDTSYLLAYVPLGNYNVKKNCIVLCFAPSDIYSAQFECEGYTPDLGKLRTKNTA
jgi:hypothetical protein